MWLVPYEELSPDQASAVGMPIDKHRIIRGGPGSGKTLVLAHRAKSLIEERGIPRKRIRVLVYTRVLKDYIRQGMTDLGLADICLGFDEWCREVLTSRGIGLPRGNVDDRTSVTRRMALDAVAKDSEPMLDAILVDEGQDLTDTMLAILPKAARHVTIAMDSAQQLYDEGSDLKRVAASLGLPPRASALLTAYRCTPHIVELASAYLDDEQERAHFRASNLMPLGAREQPVLMATDGYDTELEALIKGLQERAFVGQRSLVLLPSNRSVYGFSKRLAEKGMDIYTRSDLSFDGNRPIVLTYHSAKGLTAESVFLPSLTANAFRGLEDEHIARMLFVGITRATDWVWLGTRDTGRLPMLDRLDPLIEAGHLGVPQKPKPSVAPATKPDADDDIDNLFG